MTTSIATSNTKEDDNKEGDVHDDIVWNEHQIWDRKAAGKGDDDANNDDDDDELDNELTRQIFHMFDTSASEYETYTFQIAYPPPQQQSIDDSKMKPDSSSSSPPKFVVDLAVRGEPETNNSTGMGLWRGAEVLAQYMCDVHVASNVSSDCDYTGDGAMVCPPYPNFAWNEQRVLEVGSGLGLCGLAAHQLGASSVLLTDGDKDVLENLRYNVKQNLQKKPRELSSSSQPAPVEDNTDTGSTTTTAASNTITCPQLIWGQRLDDFRKRYGYQSVILAADCVYMTPSVDPLWQTIDALLDPLLPDEDEISGDAASSDQRRHGVVMYVNVSASTASPLLVLRTAAKYGFTWTSPAKEVMLFRRRRPGEEPPEISL